eukprot:jgi/Picre1/33820/NNA_001299.t1
MGVPPKKKSGNNSGGLLRYVCYLLVCGIIFGLIVSCITLSILLRGAKHAHHELWEQLNAQEKKTSDVYQEMASNKVVLVEQEEKANTASREQRFCNSILETTKDELAQVKSQVVMLNTDVSDAREREQTCLADVKEKAKNNQALAKELKIWMGKYKKLHKQISVAAKKPSKPVSPPRVHAPKKKSSTGGAAGDDPLLYAAMYTHHIPGRNHVPVVKKRTGGSRKYRHRDRYMKMMIVGMAHHCMMMIMSHMKLMCWKMTGSYDE